MLRAALASRVSRWATLSALAAGGCLVTFNDYPVGDLNPDSGAQGGDISVGGRGGSSGAGAAGAGGSAAVDASTGGSSTGGSSTGGSSTGGALGAAGSAGTAAGSAGMPSDAGADGDAPSPCGSTLSNPQHCGRCNHDCCGGKCEGGKCQPAVVYEGPDGGNEAPEEIAVLGDYVYFSSTHNPYLMRVRIAVGTRDGGMRETFWDERPVVTSVAADATGIYVAGISSTTDAGRSGLVEHVAPDTRETRVILDMDDYPSELTLDATHVYWRSGNSVIRRLPKAGGDAGGGAGQLGDSITGLARITALNGRAFYHQTTNSRIVQRSAQGMDQELAANEVGVSSLAANSAYVFWPLTGANKVRRVAIGARDPIDLVAGWLGVPTYSAADDNYVYWLTFGPPGALRAARADQPGAAIELVTSLVSPRKLTLDARCVYVTEGGAPGKIIVVAKP